MARVLVVEDDRVIRDLLVVNLEMEGHEVETASSGDEALERVAGARPDIVLLDMMLPGVDGWEVTSRLRDDAATASVPIVALSARAMPGDIDRGLRHGVDRYVTKPFDPIELMALVADVTSATPSTP